MGHFSKKFVKFLRIVITPYADWRSVEVAFTRFAHT